VASDDNIAILVGRTIGHLGQSALLAEVFNRVEGDAPPVDLEAEKKNGEFIRANLTWITACSDLSDGGLALAAFKMAEAAGVGVAINSDNTAEIFGEDQARYLVACNFDQAEALMVAAGAAGIPISYVGNFGGNQVRFGDTSAELSALKQIFRSSFEAVVA
jgi:phosphoribosylformylglycinamidine synthase